MPRFELAQGFTPVDLEVDVADRIHHLVHGPGPFLLLGQEISGLNVAREDEESNNCSEQGDGTLQQVKVRPGEQVFPIRYMEDSVGK